MTRLRRRRPDAVTLSPQDSMWLLIGPPPRMTFRPDWPAQEARLRDLWRAFGHLLTRREDRDEPWAAQRFGAAR